MDWNTAGHILYIACLLCLGTGMLILLLKKYPEMEIRVTASARLRVFARRLKEAAEEQSRFAEKIRQKVHSIRSRRFDMELYDSSLLLKNLALADHEHAFSADYIYERLMEHAHWLRPVYARMLNLYRGGHDQEAFQYLSDQCGSRIGRNFAMVLSKIDRISPDELVEQMEVFLEIMGQQRITAEMKRVQRNSLITTMLATVSVFAMVLDFAVVIVFMHTLTMMENIF